MQTVTKITVRKKYIQCPMINTPNTVRVNNFELKQLYVHKIEDKIRFKICNPNSFEYPNGLE